MSATSIGPWINCAPADVAAWTLASTSSEWMYGYQCDGATPRSSLTKPAWLRPSLFSIWYSKSPIAAVSISAPSSSV